MKRIPHRLRRTACTALALLLVCLTLTSCSVARPIKASKQDFAVVATCDGYDILYDELRYITCIYRDELAARYGKDIWQSAPAEYADELTQEVVEHLSINAAILSLCADFGITLEDKNIQSIVQSEVEDMITALGGRRAYRQMLADMYMTDRFVRYTLGTDACESALTQALIAADLIISSELDFVEYAMKDDHMCATYHIYIQNDEGESVEDNRTRAEEVRALLTDGTDIKSLIGSKYNEDVYTPSTPYYFMKTEYEKSYEEAAFALEIGGISEVVEGEDGFYVIVRQPLSESHIVGNLTELLQRYQYAEVEALLAEHRATMTVEWTEYGQSLDLTTLS